MTAYHGGKQKIGKQLAEVIYDISNDIAYEEDFIIKGYCEPFCGMLGVYQHIPILFKDHNLKYKAGDLNKSVILMWQATQKGWKPPISCSEEKYNILKHNGKDSAEKGFIGHQCSFGGQYFKGYAEKYGKSKTSINYGINNVKRISTNIKNVIFKQGLYTQYSNLKGYIIYCDPPYSNTMQFYKSENDFDSKEFWKWCKKMSENNIIFVSEYKAPRGFVNVFKKSLKLTGNSKNMKNNKRQEKLYVL